VRKPPPGDGQGDFFVPALYDVGTKDSRSIMDVAVFRLSKRDKRVGEVIPLRPAGWLRRGEGRPGWYGLDLGLRHCGNAGVPSHGSYEPLSRREGRETGPNIPPLY